MICCGDPKNGSSRKKKKNKVSPMMKLSLWISHSFTAGRSVVFLSSTVSSLWPRLPCFVRDLYPPPSPMFPQGTQGLPATPFW